MKIPRTLAAIIFVPLLSLVAFLCACAPQASAPTATADSSSIAAKVPKPADDQINGGVEVSFLRLEQHAAPPARCDAAIYGSITAAPGVGLCVCQPQPDGQHGDWMQVGTEQPCWPGNQ